MVTRETTDSTVCECRVQQCPAVLSCAFSPRQTGEAGDEHIQISSFLRLYHSCNAIMNWNCSTGITQPNCSCMQPTRHFVHPFMCFLCIKLPFVFHLPSASPGAPPHLQISTGDRRSTMSLQTLPSSGSTPFRTVGRIPGGAASRQMPGYPWGRRPACVAVKLAKHRWHPE